MAGLSWAPAKAVARRPVALATCCVGAFMAFLDVTIVNIAFPDIARSFDGVSLATLSWVMNAYNVVLAAFLVPAGRLADRLGARRSFLFGLAVFTLASGLCAVGPTAEWLIAARVLQAAGGAILVPTSLALLLPAFAPERRLSAVAAWGAAAALASGIGPALGGLLVDTWSWRAAFVVNVPLGVAALVAGRRALVEARDPRGGRPDLVGAALLAVALGALALAIVKGNDWEWADARTLAAFAAAAALVPVVVWRCLRRPVPIVDPALVRSRAGAGGNLGTLLFSAAFYGAILNNVLFLTGAWGWSVLEAGLATSPAPLIAAAIARPAGRLADRIGARAVIVPGLALYAAGVLALAWGAGGAPDFVARWLPGMVLVGLGVGLAYPTLGGAALLGVGAGRLSTASGVNAAARQLGAVFGVAVLVAVLSDAATAALAAHRTAWYVTAALTALAAPAALALPRPAGPRR